MSPTEAELRDCSQRWDAAMLTNDAEAIGAFMADDWTIVGPDGRVDGKARFLALVASGELTHDRMTTEDLGIRVYGDTAVTLARGTSGGRLRGTPFFVVERVSCVWVRRDDRWACVLTHLSTLVDPA